MSWIVVLIVGLIFVAVGYVLCDEIAEQARQVKPLILLAGYSAYPRLIDFGRMREIADEVLGDAKSATERWPRTSIA